ANFAIAEPPLKLVLIENQGHGGSLNHLGIEVESTGDVASATARLGSEGLATAEEEGVECCYAVQDKVWVNDPDGAPWEVYTVLADSPEFAKADAGCCDGESGASCCAPESSEKVASH
ncbi:MAG: ArsI/CadI family heavy metal resistance metalloenzyme, partial [Actinomycetota bacterium]